ncbi:MAG: sulfite exporter TauE/SafE family protein, partial [Myxococcota bacterium]
MWAILVFAGFAAGLVNAIAGGGSLLSFPALLLTGMSSVQANATNTLAVWPGAVSSAWAYRSWIREERRRALILAVPSAIGGLGGSWILLATGDSLFDAIVPWLVLFACALVALQGPIARRVAARRRSGSGLAAGLPDGDPGVSPAMWIAQLLSAFYGGYFGAGMGIVMLATIGILLPSSLQHANGLKLACALVINGVAALWFLATGAASLPHAAVMAIASIAGGWV